MEISITPSKDYDKRELGSSDKIKAKLAALREEAADKQWTFEVGYTTAMDFAIEKITGLKPPEKWLEQAKLQNSLARSMEESKRMFLGQCVASAAKFNWADQNGVTPVRDQGGCGSCWAFATHGAFEGSNAILNKAQIDSAEQDTLDCSGSGSCSGGWWAFQHLIDKGSAGALCLCGERPQPLRAGVQRRFNHRAHGVHIVSTEANQELETWIHEVRLKRCTCQSWLMHRHSSPRERQLSPSRPVCTRTRRRTRCGLDRSARGRSRPPISTFRSTALMR